MAKTIKTIVNLFVALVVLVATSCADALHNEMAPQTTAEVVSPYGEPVDSTHVTLCDSTGRILETGFNLGRYAEVSVEPTLHADAQEAWQPAERLARNVAESAETAFRYNHGTNTIGTRVSLVVRQEYYRDLGDGRVIRLMQGDIIPLYQPERLNLKGGEPATEVREGKLYYAETSVKYSLRYDEVVLAEGVQPFVAEEGYVPAFEALEWGANHVKGTATASYDQSKSNIIVTCTDTLWAKEKWDNGEYKNVLSTYTHSKHSYGVQISGTENVASISAIVGKDMNVSGNKATLAEVTLTLTEILNEIVEKSVPYTYNGKSINFVDSLHACSYQLYGAKYTTSSNVHVVLVRKSDSEKVSVDITKPLTEKVTVVKSVPAFSHVRTITNPTPQGKNVAIARYDEVVVTDHLSNGTTKVAGSAEYPVTTNYTVSYTSNIQVENLQSFCGRYDLVNGAVSVQGYNFSTTEGSTVYGDAIVAGKNYKSQAPHCPVTPIAVTINENSLVYEYKASHDGHNDIIKVTFAFTVTQKQKPADVEVEILRISITDSYTNQHTSQEGTDLHIFGKDKGGNYVVLSQRVGATTGFQSTSLSNSDGKAIYDCGRAIAYVYNGSSYQIGTVTSEDGKADKGFYLRYYVADGRLAYSLGSGTATEALKDGFRDAIRGTVSKANSDGSWSVTADGKTYVFRGL